MTVLMSATMRTIVCYLKQHLIFIADEQNKLPLETLKPILQIQIEEKKEFKESNLRGLNQQTLDYVNQGLELQVMHNST